MSRLFTGKIIAFAFLSVIFDVTLVPIFQIHGVKPFLSYLFILYAAFQWGNKSIFPLALIVAALREAFISQSLGVEAASLILASILLDLWVQKMERELIILRMISAFLFTAVVLSIHYILFGFLNGFQTETWYHFTILMGAAFYTTCLTPFYFFIAAWWFRDHQPFQQYELFR